MIHRPPPNSKNRFKRDDFALEFTDMIEKLATTLGKLLIVDDFNVHWDNKSSPETEASNLR